MNKIDILRKDLVRLYKNERLNIYEIARKYKCSPACISKRLKEYSISTWWKPVKITSDELKRSYLNKKMTMKEIAEYIGCGQTTIVAKIHRFGIKSRKNIPRISAKKLDILYHKNKMHQSLIAKQFNCDQATISNRMKSLNVPRRTKSEISSKYPRYNFSGDLLEKSYLIGFRLGDLHVHKHRLLISVSTTTTKSEQICLFKTLFEKYSHIKLRRHLSGFNHNNKNKSHIITTLLNDGFSFLLPKEDRIPIWILKNEKFFLSFLAGYVDAEGCLSISKNKKWLSLALIIRTYDKNILRQIWMKLNMLGIICPKSRFALKRGLQNNKKDFWVFGVYRRKHLVKLIKMLEPYIKHDSRKSKVKSIKSIFLGEKIYETNWAST